jgi:hypothetical protein
VKGCFCGKEHPDDTLRVLLLQQGSQYRAEGLASCLGFSAIATGATPLDALLALCELAAIEQLDSGVLR